MKLVINKTEFGHITIDELMALPAASVQDIECQDVLDYLPEDALIKVLSRIKHGGSILIDGVDLVEVNRGIITRSLELGAASQLLYSGRLRTLTIQTVLNVLTQSKFTIILKKCNNYK
jgi:hypothetical protein